MTRNTLTDAPDCEGFYRRRDERSVAYTGRSLAGLPPVHVAIDAASCATAAGQLLLLALANQLARVFRRISFGLAAGDRATLARTPFPGECLVQVLLETVRAVDPCGEFVITDQRPSGSIAIGIGAELASGMDWYAGADRAVGLLRHFPVRVSAEPSSIRGAALASCMGCAAVFRQALDLPTSERALSAWNFAEGSAAAFGPESPPTIDVGSVLMVGAGAVGASLAFWLHAFGACCTDWTVVDGDIVELHNINRGLVFTALHAGWPRGQPAMKAQVVAALLPGAISHDVWYHDCTAIAEQGFDVVLALANDYGVRERLTQRHAAVSFQATTGDNWLSQLHRHILGRDGCIACRTGELVLPRFQCSTGVVETPNGERFDASLPFLSAASGLMLASALEQLTLGTLPDDVANCWSWDFDSPYRMALRPERRLCTESCTRVPPAELCAKLTAGSRWGGLIATTHARG